MKKNYIYSAVLAMAVSLPFISFSQSQGPNSPAQAISIPSVNGKPWLTPTNVFAADNQYATAAPLEKVGTCTGPTCYYTQGIASASFGFTIPLTATISGIIVEVQRMALNGPNAVMDSSLRLFKAGVLTGANKASSTAWSGSSIGYTSYGSSSDLWGATWTPTDINNINFGVRISAINTSSVYTPGAMINHIRITVYYVLTGIQYSATSSTDDMLHANMVSNESLSVNYNLGSEANGTLSIMNIAGQMVYLKEVTVNKGTEQVNTGQYAAGTYFVRIVAGNNTQTQKIMIGQ